MSTLSTLNKILLISFFIILASITSYFTWNYFKTKETKVLIIGAGSKKGEAYQFAQAIAEVVGRHYPELHIRVRETAGSKENMELLQAGQIDLATVQADISSVPSARIITKLYPDMYQLIVRKDVNINTFHDLKGKRVVSSSKGGGQWASFWFTANHYGLYESDIKSIFLSSNAAVDAFFNGEIDAIFKVRAPRNQTILNILQSCPSKLIPIDQAAAMKLKQPALNLGHIPTGAYSGNPLIPEKDLPTISVDRLLIGNKNADEEAVRSITEILFERRLELLKTTPLAGFITQPNWNAGTFIPLHDGALAYYNREKPSFFVENADFVALLLSILLMLGSGLLGLRNKIALRKKDVADEHSKQLIKLMDNFLEKETIDKAFILENRKKLQKMLANVINELDKDIITPEGFQFFSFTWDKANDLLNKMERKIN